MDIISFMPERFRDDPSYQQMIRSFSEGKQAGLAELYDRYAPSLLGMINQILNDHERAGDCLQHSFNEIWNKKASYDGSKERIFTWMHRIARSSALNFLKNGHDSFNPSHHANAEGLKRHPKSISPVERKYQQAPIVSTDPHEVLRLVFIKGLTIVKAAKRLNISLETAKFQLISALRQFKGKVST